MGSQHYHNPDFFYIKNSTPHYNRETSSSDDISGRNVISTKYSITKILKILKIFDFFRTDFSKISNILDIPSPSAAGRLQKLDFHHFGEKSRKLKISLNQWWDLFKVPKVYSFKNWDSLLAGLVSFTQIFHADRVYCRFHFSSAIFFRKLFIS